MSSKKSFWKNRKGEMTGGAIVGLVIGVVLAAVISANLAPVAIEAFYGSNTTAWHFEGASEDTKVTTLWELMPLFIALIILGAFVAVVMRVLG